MIKSNDYLFELSWEVCNKIGGIHTVITSKINEVRKNFSNHYFLGIFNEQTEKKIQKIPIPRQFESEIGKIENLGIKIHFGKWLDEGQNTNVILVEYLGYSSNINEIKKQLWEKYSIDSLNSNWYDFDEAILWSWVCGIVIEKLTENINSNVLVHAHEWMAGGSILYLKSLENSKYKTIFTTHATMLGRSISGSGESLYDIIDEINPDEKSYEKNVQTKHQTEKALALSSDCFTTVSEITAYESEKFYSKKPDVILHNGFDTKKISNESKSIMKNFLKGHFYNCCDCEFENTTILYTSGRFEFRNKGMDTLIEALGQLNQKLKSEKSDKKIICVFLILMGEFERSQTAQNSFENFRKNMKPENETINAALSTHNVPIDNDIIRNFINEDLINRKEDNVKVVLFPTEVKKGEYYFNCDYYDAISGCDLGIFASEYEPWGYTPLESIAYEVPTITSNLAGFGRYIEREFSKNNESVYVLKREKIKHEEIVKDLKKEIEGYSNLTVRDKNKLRKKARKFSKNFTWKKFYLNYLKAYDFAKKNNTVKTQVNLNLKEFE